MLDTQPISCCFKWCIVETVHYRLLLVTYIEETACPKAVWCPKEVAVKLEFDPVIGLHPPTSRLSLGRANLATPLKFLLPSGQQLS